ncbi:hypothetical protein HY025_04375 [Candidatus Daviesbacteria bacterium]|nr:hypothetical protein [Candidatus Daviesbacteria bacterium]
MLRNKNQTHKKRVVLFFSLPLFFLIIIKLVLNSPGGLKKVKTSDCKNISNNITKNQCWEDLLGITLENNGIKEAFLVFADLYNTDPQFVSSCHSFAHTLGKAAYKLYTSGKVFDWPSQTAYCGYGFYHGLTELLLQNQGPIEAGKLCDSKKSQITQVLYDACYHGIGHGALSQTASKKDIWGSPPNMVDAALDICKQATNDPIQQSRCASGVFMELGSDYTDNQISLNKKDPLEICRRQGDFGKMDCYTQMNGVLNQIAGGKLKESAKFVETIKEDKYAVEAIETLAAPVINITKTDFRDDISVCRNLQERLHLACIKGLVLGFMLRGRPGIEYEDSIKFCSMGIMSESEKGACFDLVLRHSKSLYADDIFKTICEKVDLRFRANLCSNN